MADPTDEGTVWFSDSDAEEKILIYLNTLSEDGYLARCNNDSKGTAATKFLDLGTGNGHLLFALQDDGWRGRMVGVDYSEESVKLARRIAAARAATVKNDVSDDPSELSKCPLDFATYNILGSKDATPEWFREKFDCLLDKGTFDAVSLSKVEDAEGKHGSDIYALHIQRFVRPGGFLVVTSCNWTEDELRAWFTTQQTEFEFFGRISYPSFTFGGKTGQTIVTICFRRKQSG